MLVVFGDVWKYPADYICIPTNGTLKLDTALVMGRGVAFQSKFRYTGIDYLMGALISRRGNHVGVVRFRNSEELFCTFPVKHNWWEQADLDLISQSAKELAELAASLPDSDFVLPRPGCGNGQRTWEEVYPLLVDVLPDNVHVIDRKES